MYLNYEMLDRLGDKTKFQVCWTGAHFYRHCLFHIIECNEMNTEFYYIYNDLYLFCIWVQISYQENFINHVWNNLLYQWQWQNFRIPLTSPFFASCVAILIKTLASVCVSPFFVVIDNVIGVLSRPFIRITSTLSFSNVIR